MSKKVLVTGGSGFIGSHIVDQLVKKKYKVTIIDKIQAKRKDVKYIRSNNLKLNFLKKATKNIDYVFHLAAVSDINKVSSNPIYTIENNILATAYLLEASRFNNVKKFLFASSMYAHGRAGNLYTTSKKASELMIKDYSLLYNLKYTILRFPTAFGERNRNVDVVSIFIRRCFKNLNIYIHGDGKQTRNFFNVKDIAEASVTALSKKFTNRSMTLGTKINTKIIDLAKKIIKLTKSKSKIIIIKKKKRFDDFDSKKINKIDNKNFIKLNKKYNLELDLKNYIKTLKVN
ncbi:NAD-dependent epimerase/dehydratase family protein [Pelagibacteraceae bacterium]|nr:NAD-dependent epimerase/dehydratase family protein [Pelagibacteraceae bacterium]